MIVLKTANGVAVFSPAPGQDAAPEGVWREVAQAPNAPMEQWRWTDEGPLDIAPPDVSAWRETAFLSRMEFCLAIKRAGILTPQEAVSAAKGDMPAIFAAAVGEQDVDEAAIVWAAARQIERAHPLLELARLHLGWTPEQVDTLFGWV